MTLKLLDLLDPSVCEQVLYFSTASVLNRENQPLPEAGTLGSAYVRTKYQCLTRLPESKMAPRITALFPTVVLGEGARESNVRLSTLLPQVLKRAGLMRFVKADASFHFIHGRDIAQVVRYLVDHPETAVGPRLRVLGQERVTFDQMIEDLCAYLGKPIYWRLSLTGALLNAVSRAARADGPGIDSCLSYRHFSYRDPVNRALRPPNFCATITGILKIGGIAPHPGDPPCGDGEAIAAQDGESEPSSFSVSTYVARASAHHHDRDNRFSGADGAGHQVPPGVGGATALQHLDYPLTPTLRAALAG
jgi:hypothetical protein